MKVPTSFADEPAAAGGLFDFSSTTATRILAVVAAEGATPFVGAWLRERVAASVPERLHGAPAWTRTPGTPARRGRWAAPTSCRPIRCSCRPTATRWTSWSAGTPIATARCARDRTVRAAETAATFYYALAVDALVTPESASAAQAEAGVARGR